MISVVMPVHNTGEFLRESITSLRNQTYSDFELICVDDASDDFLTKRILQEYKSRDQRISIITLEKRIGAAKARNIGMKAACGTYIIFLDADDIFDSVMLEKMHGAISKNNADICVCGHRDYLNDKKRIDAVIYPMQKEHITDRVFKLSELSEDGLLYWSTAPWNKLCRKKFLDDKKIYFQTLQSSNDVFFSCMCSIYAEKIVYCENGVPLLNYRKNTKNQISAERDPIDCFEAVSFLLNKMETPIDLLRYKQIMYLLIVGVIGNIQLCKDNKKNRKAYNLVKMYLQNEKDILVFDNKQVNNMYMYFKREEYDTDWINIRGDFYSQLKKSEKKLFENIHEKKQIVIWGNGARGNALQKLLREKNVNSETIFVSDLKNENLGEITQYGYRILDTNQAIEIAEIVIATNKEIYCYLQKQYQLRGIDIVELEKYCPFQ